MAHGRAPRAGLQRAVGERASPTQPFPSKPAAFDVQGLSEEDVIDFTPALKAEALEILSNYTYGPLYTPPSERGTLMVPGLIGGADWAGAAADPERSVLYVPSHTLPLSLGWDRRAVAIRAMRPIPTSAFADRRACR